MTATQPGEGDKKTRLDVAMTETAQDVCEVLWRGGAAAQVLERRHRRGIRCRLPSVRRRHQLRSGAVGVPVWIAAVGGAPLRRLRQRLLQLPLLLLLPLQSGHL